MSLKTVFVSTVAFAVSLVIAGTATAATLYGSPATFYPLVHDGFRDTYLMEVEAPDYEAPRGAYCTVESGSVRIANESGQVIQTLGLNFDYYGDWAERRWGGRKADGRFVLPGSFAVTASVSYECDDGLYEVADTNTRYVNVATRFITRRIFKNKLAYRWSGRAATGDCQSARYGFDGTVWLSCYGNGGFARATWKFAVPANARALRGSYRYSFIYDAGGTLNGTMARPRRNLVRVAVKLTGNRTAEIRRVYLSYEVKIRQ